MSDVKHDIQNEPMFIYASTFKKLLNEDKDALTLYLFYYYTSKYQDTKRIWCTIEFASKGTGIGLKKTRQMKKILMDMGLIEEIQTIDEDSGQFAKRYIYVKFNRPANFDEGGENDRQMLKTNNKENTKTSEDKKIYKKEMSTEAQTSLFDAGSSEGDIRLKLQGKTYKAKEDAVRNITPPAEYTEFWKKYLKYQNGAKHLAFAEYLCLSDDARADAIKYVDYYLREKGNYAMRCDRYLRDSLWEKYKEEAETNSEIDEEFNKYITTEEVVISKAKETNKCCDCAHANLIGNIGTCSLSGLNILSNQPKCENYKEN